VSFSFGFAYKKQLDPRLRAVCGFFRFSSKLTVFVYFTFADAVMVLPWAFVFFSSINKFKSIFSLGNGVFVRACI